MQENQESIIVQDEIDLTQEGYQEIKAEYEKIKGEESKESETGTGNKTELKDSTYEALITDPNLILSDFTSLCKKHNLSAADLLSSMGFNEQILKAVILNKPITEQIYVLNRELSLVLFELGEQSGTVEEGYSTINIRSLLGEVGTSRDWLELLDKQILPYIAYFKENGKIDKDWFTREGNTMADVDETEATFKAIGEISNAQNEFIGELEEMTNQMKPLFDENGELVEGEVILPEEQEAFELQAQEASESQEMTVEHGEETVLETNEQEVNEAQQDLFEQEQPVVEDTTEQ